MSIHPRIPLLIKSSATVLMASAAVVGAVVAATTIGSNLYSDGGALFNKSSTTAFQVENGSGTDVLRVDTSNSGTILTGAATTTVYHWLGTGGTANNLGYTGGELYVQDDVEIDGVAYMNRATSTSATSTAYLYVGPAFTMPAGFDFAGGDAAVGSDLVVGNKATTTAGLWVGGTTGVLNNGNMTGGDVYIQDALEVDGGTWLDRATTTDTLAVGSNSLGQLSVTVGAAARVGIGVRAAASATNNLFEVQNSSGTFLSGFTASGGMLINVASTTALRVQGSGTEIFSVDTTSTPKGVTITGNATVTSEFIVGTTSWADATNTMTVVGSQAVTGNATTSGDFVVGQPTTAATTTVKIKADSTGGNGSSCLEMVDVEGTTRAVYVNGAGALTVASGACK